MPSNFGTMIWNIKGKNTSQLQYRQKMIAIIIIVLFIIAEVGKFLLYYLR
jgi:hypothetical protein